MKKFITVCEGGNVRSVGLAYLLKVHGQDAIAMSWRFNNPETLGKMFNWADYIVIMQAKFKEHIAEIFHHKLLVVDVGEDRYGYAFHPELQGGLTPIVKDWQSKNWEIT